MGMAGMAGGLSCVLDQVSLHNSRANGWEVGLEPQREATLGVILIFNTLLPFLAVMTTTICPIWRQVPLVHGGPPPLYFNMRM